MSKDAEETSATGSHMQHVPRAEYAVHAFPPANLRAQIFMLADRRKGSAIGDAIKNWARRRPRPALGLPSMVAPAPGVSASGRRASCWAVMDRG